MHRCMRVQCRVEPPRWVYVYTCDVSKSRGQKCTQAREGPAKWSTNAAYDVNWKLRYNYAFPNSCGQSESGLSQLFLLCIDWVPPCVCIYICICKYYVQAQQTLTSLPLLLSLLLLLLLCHSQSSPQQRQRQKIPMLIRHLWACVRARKRERESASDGVIESRASRAPSEIKREGVRVVVLCCAAFVSCFMFWLCAGRAIIIAIAHRFFCCYCCCCWFSFVLDLRRTLE